MTVFKWLAGGLMSLLLILVLAIFLLPMIIDPNDYRQAITELVQEKTGRELKLDGELKISVFPWLGIRTQKLSFSQPPEIGGQMVQVETAQLRLKLVPLLSKQLEIDTVILESPTLRLITLANGVSSFTGLSGEEVSDDAGDSLASAPLSSQEQSTQSDSNAGAQATNQDAAVALVVSGLEVTNADVLWDDRQAGQKYQITDFNLLTGNLLGADFADIELSGAVVDAANPTPIALQLNGQARINSDTLVVQMEGVNAQIEQGDQNLDLSFSQLQIDQQSSLDLNDLELRAAFEIPAEDAPAQKGNIQLSLAGLSYGFAGKPAETSRLIANALNLSGRFVERDFVVAAPVLQAHLDSQTADIKELAVSSGDLNAQLSNLTVRQFIDKPSASGRLSMTPFNAVKLLEDLAIDYQPSGPEALKAVALSTDFSGGMQNIALNNLDIKLDQSVLRGKIAINDFTKLSATFDLSLNEINLDNYLPVATTEGEKPVTGGEALVVPFALMRGVDANGSFKANRLITGGLELNDIDVQVESINGRLTVTPNAKLYDGSLGGKIAFSESANETKLSVKNDIDLVDLAKLLNAADVSDQLSGIGSVNVDVAFTEKDGVQSNQGVIKLLAKNGALKGVDIKKMLDTAYATYTKFTGGASASEADTDGEIDGELKTNDETRFAELIGTFYLQDYVLSNDDFSLKAPLFRVSGNGTIDIAKQTLDYLVKVAVVGTSDGQGGKAIEELSGITIPIRLRGDLTAPSFSLDMQSLYQSYAKRQLDKKKGELLQKELGIEGGEKMSTKDILKGVLLKELSKDSDKKKAAQSEPVPYEQTESAASADKQSDPVPYEETESGTATEPEREMTKKERREERKRRLLEGLFNDKSE